MALMSYFSNATITITRSEGSRGPSGYTESGTTTVLSSRCDAQLSGRSLERLQQLHETGDALCFIEGPIQSVEPGDSVTLNMDDGRSLEGSVEVAGDLGSSLLVAL